MGLPYWRSRVYKNFYYAHAQIGLNNILFKNLKHDNDI